MERDTAVKPDPATLVPPSSFDRARGQALTIGGFASLLVLVGAVIDPAQFFRSYLVGYVLWLGISLGCLAIAMLQHLTGGAWGIMIRRILEAAGRTLPLMTVLFLPLLAGLGHLYAWSDPEVVARDPILLQKSLYLNVPFFVVRAAIMFAIWNVLALLLVRWSRAQDHDPDLVFTRRLRLLNGPSLGIYCLTASFASFDWLMSLEPHWFSTIYGIHFVGGQALSAFAFAVIVAHRLSRQPPMSELYASRHFNDYGNLILAFVMLWAYFTVSQFLIIWSGNLPEEIHWYEQRLHGGWGAVGLVLAFVHFGLPFVLLLSRRIKQSGGALAGLGGLLLVMRWLDLLWQVGPAFRHGFPIHWLDVVAPVAVGGFWIALFLHGLRRQPLLPVNDPYLERAIGAG